MINYLAYLSYVTPVIFIVLSFKYHTQLNELRNSGKIPDIMMARQRETMFSVLAVLSALAIIIALV